VLIADDPQLFAALAALVRDARLYLGLRASREPPADAGRRATPLSDRRNVEFSIDSV
jgi:hypothetical protein